MERIAKPLLTGVLIWLLALSSGAIPGRLLHPDRHAGPFGHQSGHRPYLPAKKGLIFSRQDEPLKLSRLPKAPARAGVVAAPILHCSTYPHDVWLVRLGLHHQPLYLLDCKLLV
jgi:hypothetical protein